MNETQTTVRGTILTDPRTRRHGETQVLDFRLASNSRYLDRETGEWRTGSTLYLSVALWGRLAENAAGVLTKGDGVIVQGRLATNEYEWEGARRSDLEMRATAIGPDLSRMTVTVRRRPAAAEDAAETGAAGDADRAADESVDAAPDDAADDGRERELVGAGSGATATGAAPF